MLEDSLFQSSPARLARGSKRSTVLDAQGTTLDQVRNRGLDHPVRSTSKEGDLGEPKRETRARWRRRPEPVAHRHADGERDQKSDSINQQRGSSPASGWGGSTTYFLKGEDIAVSSECDESSSDSSHMNVPTSPAFFANSALIAIDLGFS